MRLIWMLLIQDPGIFILVCFMVWPPFRNLGMATLEQSDSICWGFIRPLGPFGLVKHELKPGPLSHVISHGEPDTILLTSVRTCWLLLLLLILCLFEPLIEAPMKSFVAYVRTKKCSTKYCFLLLFFFFVCSLTGFKCFRILPQREKLCMSKHYYVCHMWSCHMLLLGKKKRKHLLQKQHLNIPSKLLLQEDNQSVTRGNWFTGWRLSYYSHGLVELHERSFHKLFSKKDFIGWFSLMMPLRESAVFVSS